MTFSLKRTMGVAVMTGAALTMAGCGRNDMGSPAVNHAAAEQADVDAAKKIRETMYVLRERAAKNCNDEGRVPRDAVRSAELAGDILVFNQMAQPVRLGGMGDKTLHFQRNAGEGRGYFKDAVQGQPRIDAIAKSDITLVSTLLIDVEQRGYGFSPLLSYVHDAKSGRKTLTVYAPASTDSLSGIYTPYVDGKIIDEFFDKVLGEQGKLPGTIALVQNRDKTVIRVAAAGQPVHGIEGMQTTRVDLAPSCLK